MVAKSKSSKGIFAPGDCRPRGSGHDGWLKMPRKSKYIRGEASKKVSKTGASILRDLTQLSVQAPPCNCDQGAPPLSPN